MLTATIEVPEVLCGVNDGGQASGHFCNFTDDPSVPSGAILAQSQPGTFMAGGTSGQVQMYVLVRNGVIVQSNLTGLFTGLPSDTYQVYAVNFRDDEDVANFLIPGESFQPVLDGLNGMGPLANACYTVCNTSPPITIDVNCFSLGSTVFVDLDDDGVYEPGDGETGIPGVTVELYAAGDTPGVDDPIATTTTGPNGDYYFGGLPVGDYVVSIPTAPNDFPTSSTGATAGTDDNDNGMQTTSGDRTTSGVITLSEGDEPNDGDGDEDGQAGDQDDNVAYPEGGMSNDDANGDMTVDFGFVPIFDLALTKVVSAPATGMVMPGDAVTFTITVENQGMVDATDVVITDYIPAGLSYNVASNGLGWTDNGATASTTIDNLDVGESTTIDIVFTVDGGTDGDVIVNLAEISDASGPSGNPLPDVDSTPDADSTNDAGGAPNTGSDDVTSGDGTGAPGDTDPNTDEDDADPAQIMVNPFDLALTKVVAAPASGMVMPGDAVTFTITVENQGMVDAQNVVITDYIPAGLTYNVASNGLGWTDNGATATATIADLDAGQSTTIDIVFTVNAGTDGDVITNVAEISSAQDDQGGTPTDVDSTPDADSTNDAGGEPGTAADNATTGNGSGAPGDGQEGTDEDDADPAQIMVNPFDLALTKVLSAPANGVVMPGDAVTFTITVENQGMVDAQNVVITDYIPAGLTYNVASNGLGWTDNGATASATIADLDAGQSTTIDIVFTVNGGTDGDVITNVAEISSAQDDLGGTPTDVDSTPDADSTNDAGGEAGTPSDDATTGNGTGAPGDTEENTDEDDADPAQITVASFDLALTKVVSMPADGVVMPGDAVTFTITVENQGMVDAENVVITDYIPAGLTYNAASNGLGWTDNGATASATIADLDAGQSTTIDIVFTVNGGTDGDVITNLAEISSAEDNAGGTPTDIDSTPDTDGTNDAGGEPETGSDDVTSGDGSGAPGDTDPNTDEDDADPAQIMVAPFDLALTKVVSMPADGVVMPGDAVTFTITVENQGMVDAQNVVITDYIPAGLTYNAASNGLGWTDNGATASATIADLDAGQSTTIDIVFTVNGGTDGDVITNLAEISSAEDDAGGTPTDIDSTPDTDGTNDAGGEPETGSDDVTSGDGSGAPGDTDPNTDEDDADPAQIMVAPFDLALTKVVSMPADGVVMPGDAVTFTITVENQGMVDAQNVVITDYIPAGLTYNAASNGLGWTDNGATASATIADLDAGQSTTIDIVFTVNGGTDGDVITNLAEISSAEDDAGGTPTDIDSTPDTDGTNDAGGEPGTPSDDATTGNGTGAPGDTEENTDEDDADPAQIMVAPFDLALTKVVSMPADGVVMPGDAVTFTITVENQGMVDAQNVVITDYIPAGLTYNTASNGLGWTDNGATASATIADLDAGQSTTIDIVFTVNGGTDGDVITNLAEISSAEDDAGGTPTDIDSTPDTDGTNDAGGEPGTPSDDATTGNGTGAPGDTEENTDEDDADPAQIMVAPFDLALTKVVSNPANGMVMPGDVVTFTITVENQGMVDAQNVVITDYIPAGLTYNAASNGLGWTDNGATASATIADLDAGQSTTIDIVFTVNGGTDGDVITNLAEISSAEDDAGGTPTDIDSTPDADGTNDAGGGPGTPSDDVTSGDGSGAPGDTDPNTDEDDADPALIRVNPFDLALTKVLSAGQEPVVEPGDEVSFTITVTNQGMVTAANIEVTDYIPTGLSFSANNDGAIWTDNGDGTATAAIAGELASGESTTLTILLTVDAGTDGEDLVNVAEISAATDSEGGAVEDIDSTPDTDDGNDAGGAVGTP
ncbi:SdrD B-like domain-containing protein, partial [Lewinella sp. W8]|uniref:SdrD B-like domain-containing protein n=1 Tax=Lewinella sp. W8 TaxID=2528208 RepID=UPI001C12BFF0